MVGEPGETGVHRRAQRDDGRQLIQRLLRFNHGGGNQRDQNLVVADQ